MDFIEDEELYKKIGIYLPTVRRLLSLAIEIVREGMEGKPIGTMFVIGDSENVLKIFPLNISPYFSSSIVRLRASSLNEADPGKNFARRAKPNRIIFLIKSKFQIVSFLKGL